jgi:predicted nucleic acid-binding Zn ribbon protein
MTCMVVRFVVSDDSAGDGAGREADTGRDTSWRPRLSTVGSGKPGEVVDEQHANTAMSDTSLASVSSDSDDIALGALAQAQLITRTSRQPRRRSRRRSVDRESGYSGSGPDDRDPQPLRGLLNGLVDERGWQRPLAEARLFADWGTLVGPDIASHCTPSALREGELRIQAESTAWATQLQMMAGSMLASLARQLGPEVVRKVFITGPTGPSWKHGGWSVRGARGPRDTYG